MVFAKYTTRPLPHAPRVTTGIFVVARIALYSGMLMVAPSCAITGGISVSGTAWLAAALTSINAPSLGIRSVSPMPSSNGSSCTSSLAYEDLSPSRLPVRVMPSTVSNAGVARGLPSPSHCPASKLAIKPPPAWAYCSSAATAESATQARLEITTTP